MVTVEATGLGKRYRGRTVLSDATFSLPESSLTVLAGPNGAGKTTLMKRMVEMVAGDGHTSFDGRRWKQLADPRREVGVYLGVGSFHAGVTAESHLRLVATAARVRSAAVEVALEQFGLGPHRRTKVSQLSLGLRQRLGIASATLPDPPVLILDEPFSALDPSEASDVYGWLAGQVADKKALLISTHQLTRIEPYASHLLFVKGGRVVADGRLSGTDACYEAPRRMAVACSTPVDLAAALAKAGITASIRSGDALVVGGTSEQVAAAAEAANVEIYAQWTSTPGLSTLYEAIVL